MNIPGAVASTYSIASVVLGDAGSYDCVVRNICSTATSGSATLTFCPPDFDCSGHLEVQDIFAFLIAWFALDPRSDFNNDGHTNPGDIFSFLGAWFAGCP